MFGITLVIAFELLPTNDGGRSLPIRSGYRPLCAFRDTDGKEVIVGLCELATDAPVFPGSTGSGRLGFDVQVAGVVRELIRSNARFELKEGARTVGTANVTRIE